MKRSEISIGQRVAVVKGDQSYRTEFGVVTSTTAVKRVYSGSRDWRGHMSDPKYIEVAVDGFSGKPSTRNEIVPCNQIRDEQEVRSAMTKKAEQKQATENYIESTKTKAEASVGYINSALGDTFARARPTVEYGGYRITGWHVDISATGADKLATLLNDAGLCK